MEKLAIKWINNNLKCQKPNGNINRKNNSRLNIFSNVKVQTIYKFMHRVIIFTLTCICTLSLNNRN